jgi:hypothetical protein
MPWVRKHPRAARVNWIIGIMGGLLIGLLLGYERWGSTAAVVSIVERELSATEARIADAENRLIRLEAKLLLQENSEPSAEAKGSSPNMEKRMSQGSAMNANNAMSRAVDTY